jgi:hypothetical protein
MQRNQILRVDPFSDIFSNPEFVRHQRIERMISVQLSKLYFFLVALRIFEIAPIPELHAELQANDASLYANCKPFGHSIQSTANARR